MVKRWRELLFNPNPIRVRVNKSLCIYTARRIVCDTQRGRWPREALTYLQQSEVVFDEQHPRVHSS